MAMSIYTNTASLNAQRHLNSSSMNYNKSLTRLSSGLRINSASDDAAGLAISTGLTAQYNGLNQAVRNAGDGLSLLGTAESAMDEQVNLLQRMRELAVQSASDTNSNSNRSSINDEVKQLKSEFDRIAKTVQFNGLNLLDGSFTSKDIQVGAYSGVDQKISVDISGSLSSTLGKNYNMAASGAVTGSALTDGSFKITAGATTTSIGASADGSAKSIAAAINEKTATTGVTATASSTVDGTAAQTTGAAASYNATGSAVDSTKTTIASGDIHIFVDPSGTNTDVSVGAVSDGDAGDDGISAKDVKAAIDTALSGASVSGFTVTANGPTVTGSTAATDYSSGTLKINGTTIDLSGANDQANFESALTGATVAGVTISVDASHNISVASTDGRNIKIESSAGAVETALNSGTTEGTVKIDGPQNFSVAETANSSGLDGVTVNSVAATNTIADGDIKINGTSIGALTQGSTTSSTAIIDAINSISDQTGVTASLDSSTHVITLDAAEGEDIKVELANNGGALSGLAAATTHGTLSLSSNKGEFSVTDSGSATGLSGDATVGSNSLNTIDVSDKSGATTAIDTIDSALESLNSQRAAIGAQTNRLNSVVSNLSAAAQNIASSNSRILDADFASETANLTRAQILQQAGVSVLKQANQAPQLALSLLQ